MIAGLAAVGMVGALRPACGQSAWPNYPNNTAISVSTSAYVGIGASSPTAKLSVVNNGSTGGTRVNWWADLQGNACGIATVGSNLYLNPNSDCTTWKWANTHPTLGGSAIQFNAYGDQNAILFVRGSGATTADATAALAESMRISSNGNVGIGTTSPQYKLAVNGAIGAKEVIVTNSGWPDYVFRPGYRLRPLSEVGAYIRAHRHLPDIPSEAEVKEKGISLGEMQAKLLAKIEELTLHLIQQDEDHRELRERLAQLESRAAGR